MPQWPKHIKKLVLIFASLCTAFFSHNSVSSSTNFTVNKLGFLEKQGLDVLVFNNHYQGVFGDAKTSGIELIHHGVRSVTNGDVRLQTTPEQWDDIPEFIEQIIHPDGRIEAVMEYSKHKFRYSVIAKPIGEDIEITVNLANALPESLIGKAGFNLEFLPSTYAESGFMTENNVGTLPLYPVGEKEINGQTIPRAIAVGHSITFAPGDPSKRVSIHSNGTSLSLYDGRSKAQNGWFVLRSLLPINRTGEVINWRLSAGSLPNWQRQPVISHSQVGYHPDQKKVITIEFDKNVNKKYKDAQLWRLSADGKHHLVSEKKPLNWGAYKRYQYAQVDFSEVKKTGLYRVSYDGVEGSVFRIDTGIYSDIWHPTMDIFFPVQMDHVLVEEAYRVWHGASHLDDAVQAPPGTVHFDLYAQDEETFTDYKAGEHIPGLNIGGWYDAGDYDIRTQTQYYTVNNLVAVWEKFQPMRDTTSVDYQRKHVALHVADRKPDLLQQIEHGALALVAQFRSVGHAISGIIVPTLEQYTHLGDGITMTDNFIYDPKLKETEIKGNRSGVADDRWAFTNKNQSLNLGSAASLAAASRALTGYNDDLAKECLNYAVATWEAEQKQPSSNFKHGNTTGGPVAYEKLRAAKELLKATGGLKYQKSIQALLPDIDKHFPRMAIPAIEAIELMDGEYKKSILQIALKHQKEKLNKEALNPFGVHISEGAWAGNAGIMSAAIQDYLLHKHFPQQFGKEEVFQGLHYILGHHPDSSISFVSGVGTRSKKTAYGANRADGSFIAGGVVPGLLILKPDFPENKEDWPFFWGENEYVITAAAQYLYLARAAEDLLR